jgi:hypothetical protein
MNTSKLIFVVGALSLTGAATWIYFNQRDAHLAQAIINSPVKAQLLGFELNRYHNDEMTTRLAGRKASLMDDGKLICEDKVRALRIRGGVREELEANKATIQFLGDAALSQQNSTVVTIELDGAVEMLRGEHRFSTEWLLYTEKTSEAFTDKPVRIDTHDEFVAAEGGMTYNIRGEALRLRGGVFGSIAPDSARASMKGKHTK